MKKIKAILPRNKAIIWSLILLITLLWGYAWVLMKEALEYMGPFTFSAFRFGIGAITLLLVVWIMKIGLPPKRYWKHLIIVGILQTSIVFLLVMYGLEFVDAGKSSVLLYSMPMWSSLLAVKFLGEKITPVRMTGLLIGMLGLLTILGWDIWTGQSFEVIFGEILIIIAAISWAISNTYYRLNVQELPKIQASAFQMFFGAIGISIAMLVMEWGDPIVLNVTSMYYILFTGILASALCFTVWFFIISKIDMVTATISTLLVPIFGLVFSSILLDEKLTAGVLTGSALIIIGIIIATITKKNPYAE
ncbi:drug/metabolite transporter (DMT)-like permease [Virgibacillus natechei]|uniref:Drug/metabolite transporter (DMT)-like permease n=1 Tax=Virgibacillus natechei TaxID=1216297 RepID=A0ABS4IJW5_9BACI|nr:DMT family transporter [Virgibacillus natechei]MBP1971217.1 drug/metabolite transporter (DMT)-like permease [Virgibacillus natechei]UZD11965.1 DMT family transporter [Virgibacillus natechei]